MKKFLYLPVLALLFASCSTDNDEILQEDAVVVTTGSPHKQKMLDTNTTVSCVNYVYGTTVVDVSGGFTNPQVVFTADVPNTRTTSIGARYTVTLEMETLSDCEDLLSGTGAITRYSLYNVTIPAIKDPSIMLTLAQLPDTCYRWRYVVEGMKNTTTGQFPCVSISTWYEEPLF